MFPVSLSLVIEARLHIFITSRTLPLLLLVLKSSLRPRQFLPHQDVICAFIVLSMHGHCPQDVDYAPVPELPQIP